MNDALQLTIRGLDTQTKQVLVKKAKQQGVSLNRYVLYALKLGAGISASNDRYDKLKNFLDDHYINPADVQAVEDALDWADRTSLDKQRREQL